MKKPVFPRILGLLVLYIAVFAGLVLLQFTNRTSFTHRNGSLVVSGFYQEDTEQPILSDTEFLISGSASVFFQGIEFILAPDRGFTMIDNQGLETEFVLEKMMVSGENIDFMLSDGSSIEFSPQFTGGNQELWIFGKLGNTVESIELPIKTPRSSKIDENDTIVVMNDNLMYSFNKTSIDTERKVLVLSQNNPNAHYAVIPDKKTFNPEDYILAEAESIRDYDNAVQIWLDQSYLAWSRLIQANPSEELVAAYLTESVKKGNYRPAVTAIPQSFLTGQQRTFNSSVFLGRLDLGLRSISAHEGETLANISRLINENSEDLFNEPHVFDDLSIRNLTTLINDGAAFVRTIDPASLHLRAIPGIFEGWRDWQTMKNGEENPFERLLEQAFFVISQNIIKLEDREAVFVQQDRDIDILYNTILGKALIEYGDASGSPERAAIGRSLILSVLHMVDQTGTFPRHITIAEDGTLQIPANETMSSFHLYTIFHHDEYYPRAIPIKSMPGMWAWTAASSVTSTMENNELDISAAFPVGETHYMIIRGVKPFAKIQLYNMDYRTDAQFERYDSSGWSYSPSEQTLLVKMKHRTNIEHVRIFY
ncbi:MAG: hypothetical protein LBV20_05365 [Treponema sp.]|jgi:hypothetical protein|nr:hypothetical protein [Treponema sp.]